MNETRENTTMQRVAELMDMHELKERARRTVADEVLAYLEPSACRKMALGIADVLSNLGDAGTTDTGPENAGWAIASLLRVAEMQDEAESEASLKAWHKEKDAKDAEKRTEGIDPEQVLTTIQLEQQEIKENAEAILFSLSQIEDFVKRIEGAGALEAEREADHA